MKSYKRHITFAWIVLICFVTGQITAIVHQHVPGYTQRVYHVAKQFPQQTVAEKCYVCDMMHHTPMALFTDLPLIPDYTVSDTQYKCEHDYIGIALILSAGRSPPLA
ncbi:hypothetical protein BEL04_23505 [Mucilaginibacter sp. PPCGB 2223]|uniref:hypothetical protein n=1 Tax=Mucilaginibacter sp. PPCGB 2223 TaxID=1886027 RepID=UPI000826D4AD|nr:hypothetical protein [Mucilaginibacter sp. PPCGB 2223]OCX50278.1 hypothetical protein BEL04_23505 [Mucilaginibacter sp. PPCGB 2223]